MYLLADWLLHKHIYTICLLFENQAPSYLCHAHLPLKHVTSHVRNVRRNCCFNGWRKARYLKIVLSFSNCTWIDGVSVVITADTVFCKATFCICVHANQRYRESYCLQLQNSRSNKGSLLLLDIGKNIYQIHALTLQDSSVFIVTILKMSNSYR